MLQNKAVLHFYMHFALKAIAIAAGVYAGISLLIIGLFGVVSSSGQVETHMNGHEFAVVIWAFIFAWNSFRDEMHFSIQHGVSRKTSFFAFVLHWVIVSLLLSIIGVILPLLLRVLGDLFSANINVESMFGPIYAGFSENTLTLYSIHLVWLWTLTMFSGFLAYFISVLLYRMEKLGKFILGGAIASLFIILPAINRVTNGAVVRFFAAVGRLFIGDVANPNPINGILFFAVLAVAFTVGAFFLIRRVKLQK